MYVGHLIETAPLKDMSDFDVSNAARIANEYLKTIENPRRRQILINFRDHSLAECVGDHEGLMATCSRKSQDYRVYNSPVMTAIMPSNYDELFSYYKGLIDSNMYLIHADVEKLVVGDDCLVLDAVIHQLYPGSVIREIFGVERVEDDAVYESLSRIGLTFTFDEEGMGNGEHAYSAGELNEDTIRKLPQDEIPAQYFSGPGTVADWHAANPDLDWPAI